MRLTSQNRKSHFQPFSINNADRKALSSNNSSDRHQYPHQKSAIGANYKQMPNPIGGFTYRNSPTTGEDAQFGVRGITQHYIGNRDGRSPQSISFPTYAEGLAETNGRRRSISDMKKSLREDTTAIISNDEACCKYADCGSDNLQQRDRPDTPHYAELICCSCGRHLRWIENPERERERQERQKPIQELLFLKHRLNDWQQQFLNNIRCEKKLSPKQLNKLAEIEMQVGGLK